MMPTPDRKDPVDDRDEFAKRLGYINNWVIDCGIDNILACLLDADSAKIAEFKTRKDACTAANDEALSRYDNATTREERAAVVGSIKPV